MLTRSDGGWPFDWGFSARVPFFQGGDRCTGGLVHAEARHNPTKKNEEKQKKKKNVKAKKKKKRKKWENSSDPIYTNPIKNFPIFWGPCQSPVQIRQDQVLSVPWSLQPRNRAAAATCGRGRCELPAIWRLTPKIASGQRFFVAGEAKTPAISALRFCVAILCRQDQVISHRPLNGPF